jgi:hypothetical protein
MRESYKGADGMRSTGSIKRKNEMTFYKDAKWFILLIASVIFLSGCKSIPTNQQMTATQNVIPTNIDPGFDSGFLSGIPCSAPCFFDSTPGITKKSEVFDNLQKYDILSSCSEKIFDDNLTSVLSCKQGFDFWFNGNNLTKIIIEPNSIITLGQVIEKFGTPENVNFSSQGITDKLTLIKLAYFEHYQFVLHFSDPTTSELQDNILSSESKILWIDYVDEETLKTYFDKCNIPWKGYGSYDLNSGC